MTTIYTTWGSVCGCCRHKHRTLEAAQRCADRDHRDCAKVGGYSDRRILEADSDGYLCCLESGQPYHPCGRTHRAAMVDDI